MTTDMTAAVETWEARMREAISVAEHAARQYATWGLVEEMVGAQREAEDLRAELAAGFFGVTW